MGEIFKIKDINTKKIIDDLSMRPKITSKQQMQQYIKKIYAYRMIDNDYAALPFNYSRENYPERFEINSVSTKPKTFKSTYKDDDQEKAFLEGHEHFTKSNCVTIECRTGFGKTLFSAYLWDHTDSVAVVAITILSLIDSWKNTFTKYFGVDEDEIQVVGEKIPNKKKSILPPPKVFICMVKRIDKLEIPKSKKVTVIVDEAHLWCTQEKLLQLLKLRADYFIACSATLKKKDGTDKLVRYFSGEVSVYRAPTISHLFVEYSSGFEFETPRSKSNELDYNALVDIVSKSEERNKLILQIIRTVIDFKRKIIVFGKRTEQLEKLHGHFKEQNEDVRAELVFKSVKKFSDCDVLFGTLSKLSTGFDYVSALNGECDGTISVILFINTIAQETTYEQAKGRGMRGESPVVIMIKDNNFLLNRHINNNKNYREQTNSEEISINSIEGLKNVFEDSIKLAEDSE